MNINNKIKINKIKYFLIICIIVLTLILLVLLVNIKYNFVSYPSFVFYFLFLIFFISLPYYKIKYTSFLIGKNGINCYYQSIFESFLKKRGKKVNVDFIYMHNVYVDYSSNLLCIIYFKKNGCINKINISLEYFNEKDILSLESRISQTIWGY